MSVSLEDAVTVLINNAKDEGKLAIDVFVLRIEVVTAKEIKLHLTNGETAFISLEKGIIGN